MLEFLLILALIYVVGRWGLPRLGPVFFSWVVKKFVKKMEADMRRKQNAHQQKYNRQYQQSYNVDHEMSIHVPRRQKNKPEISEVVKDVDYEDVR